MHRGMDGHNIYWNGTCSGVIKEIGVIEPTNLTAQVFTSGSKMATGQVVMITILITIMIMITIAITFVNILLCLSTNVYICTYMFTSCNVYNFHNVHNTFKVEAYSDEISIFIKKDFADRKAFTQENLVLQNLQTLWVERRVIQGDILSSAKVSRAISTGEIFRPCSLNFR